MNGPHREDWTQRGNNNWMLIYNDIPVKWTHGNGNGMELKHVLALNCTKKSNENGTHINNSWITMQDT